MGAAVRSIGRAWRKGSCLIGPLELFPTDGFRSRIAAQVSAATMRALGTARQSRATRFLLAAAQEAVENAGLDALALTTAAVSIGGAGGGMLGAEAWYWAHYHRSQSPTDRWHSCVLCCRHIRPMRWHVHLRIGGPRESPILACSSSAAAIATITDLIETGVVEVGLAGGVDTLTRLCFMGFNALKLLDPQPCRPFARDRRGMSLGEGAAVLVLESWQHAVARGAPLRACVAGCGLSSDAFHPTAPPADAEGAVRAMREALARAHLTPADITYINAHGTGTVQNDRAEAVALADVFGPGNVLVSSTKSLIGHAMGAAGALEAVATIGALETGLLPPTANLWEPDPAIPFDCIPHTARPVALDCAMSNSFGFGGQNVSLIFLRPEMAG